MSKIIGLLATSVLLLVLVGCENTMHGFGKDMQQAGEKIQKSS